jgi:hypothetical protein
MPERHGTSEFETFSTQRRSDTAETILLKRGHAANGRGSQVGQAAAI